MRIYWVGGGWGDRFFEGRRGEVGGCCEFHCTDGICGGRGKVD